MAEYIEREALLANLKRQYGEDLGWQCTVNMSDVGMMIEDAPAADVAEVKEGEILLPLTAEELRHLINDTISYILKMEDNNRDKEEFGYYSRKNLLEKLKRTEMSVCSCGEKREEQDDADQAGE